MKLVGVTGPIASGKTSFAAMLAEKGALVIDADAIARDVVKPGKPAWQQIINYFGEDILQPNREIDRRKLGEIVFNAPEKLASLNKIVHPHVIAQIDRELENIERQYGNGQVVVVDVPLLIEVGLHKRCDLVVVVTADEDIRFARLLKQGLPKEDAKARMKAQKDKEKLEEEADIVIKNNTTLNALREKAEEVWLRI
ncbi:MAG: dephospho-CoA kinase [Actinomycetota bacterium]|nr:dephospho-CoA kinase [Actinomycetota bacterium]